LARPIKTGLTYYPHDVDMSEDLKIRKLEAKFGLTGYAVYNKILEQQYKYAGKFDLKSEDDIILYCKEWKVKRPRLLQILEYCISLGLFENENLLSVSINKRLEEINSKRATYRNQKIKKTDEDEKNSNLEEVFLMENSSKSTQSKVKESKENKSKGNVTPPRDFLKIPFDDFHKAFKVDVEFAKYEKYDLQIYFSQAVEKYPMEKSISEIIRRVKKFISCDINSNGKFYPHLKPVKRSDSVTVAYELVKNNLEWIKSLPDKNPDEVIPQLVQKCRDPARNDTLFEAYIEKALKHYGACS
jgi:hypothetical protein